MYRSPDTQLLRMALPGALVTALLGVLLWVMRLPMLQPTAPDAVAVPTTGIASVAPAPRIGTAVPLPTIVVHHLASRAAQTPIPTSVATLAPTAASNGSGAIATSAAPASDAALKARLLQHLACLAPRARHDVALDMSAAEMAVQDDTLLSASGTIQITETDRQSILLSAEALAELDAEGGRCGETLIFGVPPLEWLPPGTRFGLGVALRDGGSVVVVVTR